MQNFKVSFFGESDDIKLAEKLCEHFKDNIDLPKKCAVVTDLDWFDCSADFDCVVYEYGKDISVKNPADEFTYSVGQSNADICALNYQERETVRSTELLCGSFMGRINIPKNSEYTVNSILVCAAVLCASGLPPVKVLKLINEKIS